MKILGVQHSQPAIPVPANACDCHVHVFGPAQRYPFSAERTYTPGDATIDELLALHDLLGIGRVVIVHPSPYGTDNACSLDATAHINRLHPHRARAVAVISESTPDDALLAMHAIGVRGVRANLHSVGVNDPAAAMRTLHECAARVAPLGWHVQTFTNLAVIAALHDRLLDLPAMLVVDHFGLARASLGANQPGFDALLDLVARGRAYVKLSAAYRISSQPDHADAAAIAHALIRANPERMLWGSDWPHPGGATGPRRQFPIEPFVPVDDGRALGRLIEWVQAAAGSADEARVLLEKILVDNPARLYDF